MRKGETDFKGKFWIGQRVKIVKLPLGITDDDVQCRKGFIYNIMGSFMHSPDNMYIRYSIEFDKPMLKPTKLAKIFGVVGHSRKISFAGEAIKEATK